jgi:cell division protein FtsQ
MLKFIEYIKSNKIWNAGVWIGMGVCLIMFAIFINKNENELKLKAIKIDIKKSDEINFIDSAKITSIINERLTNPLSNGLYIKEINISEMEKQLEKNPFIENADILLDQSGQLFIKIKQREAILRVYSSTGQTYYVSKNGYKFPAGSDFTPRVIIANGNIAESLTDSNFVSSPILQDITSIVNYCNANPFWKSQIEQLYVDNFMDIILIPKIGNHSIVFGSALFIDEKFNNLKALYSKGLNTVGWDKYNRINLKYKGQIVAEKRN